MVNMNTALLHDFFQITVRYRISYLEEDIRKNHGRGILAPIKTDHGNALRPGVVA
jgi:hypothetical protein